MNDNATRAATPAYITEMVDKYASGISNAFILYGNVADYAIPNVSLTSYLTRSFARRHVVIYNIGTGFAFPSSETKKRFIQKLGMETTQGRVQLQKLGLHRDGPSKHDVNAALLAITEFLQKTGGKDSDGSIERQSAIIIENAEMLFPAGDMRQQDERIDLNIALSWGRDPFIQSSGNLIILLSSSLSEMAAPLRAASSRYEAVEVGMPDFEARLEYIEWYLAQEQEAAEYDASYSTFTVDIPPHTMAAVTSALQRVNIEDVFLRAARSGSLVEELIHARKREIIKSEFDDVLDWYVTGTTFADVGDLTDAKAAFDRVVVAPMKAGGEMLKMVPMGILMTGPAGTGKTIMAEALATEAGVSFVSLNLGRIFSMWVGESEKKIERLKRALTALSPVICFIDEIDQAISRGEGGDSGVSQRVFKSLLEFMSDTSHRGNIVFLAATNRPDLIDPALMRPGRFDKVIPFLVPTAEGRDSIIRVMGRKYGNDPDMVPTQASIDSTENWTGAELEGAAVKALEIVQVEGLNFTEAFEVATTRILPNTGDIEFMTRLAIYYCNDLDLVPVEYHAMARERSKLKDDISEDSRSEDFKRGGREW